MPAISEGKKCKTTHPGDPQELEDYYIKDFEWTNISSDQMMSMESVLNHNFISI